MTPLRRWFLCMVWGALLAGCAAVSTAPVDVPWQCDAEGDAAVEAGDWQQGLEAHQQMLENDPSNCLALYHLGYIWGKLDDRQKEIVFYKRALTCGYNQDDRLFFNLGMALADLGQIDAAMDAFESAVSLGPANADNYFGLGLVAREAGEVVQAIAALQKAVALDPGHLEARVKLIRLCLDHSRWEEARRQLIALEQEAPDHPELPELWEMLQRRWME